MSTESSTHVRPAARPADRGRVEELLRSWYRRLRSRRLLVRDQFRRAFSKLGRTRIGSHLYYTALSRAFSREHHAVLYGRMKYHEELSAAIGGQVRLRRNVHRLEKGLISRPQRDVFAVDYIEDTIDSYVATVEAAESGLTDREEIEWCRDVLHSYFSQVGSHPRIDAARRRFEAAPDPVNRREVFKRPYLRELQHGSPVEYDALLDLARLRRSVRWFRDEPVSRELVDKALLVATQSPSACNRQPFEFLIFDDPARIQEVASCAGGSRGFRENFPMLAVVIGRQRAYFEERDRHVIYIDAALAAMSFVLALETLGISSCMINWPDVEQQERKLATLLCLEPDERPVMQIAIGYPDPQGLVPYSGKKSLERIRRYNHVRNADDA